MAMTGLNRLNSLDLSSNNLAGCVEDGALFYNTSMPYLKSLKISDNNLKVIPTRAFDRFSALEELDLSGNPIATMHIGAFEPLHLRALFLNTSSLLCDCHASWFANWLFTSNIDRLHIVARCAHPIPLAGIDVVAIDISNLTCGETYTQFPKYMIIRREFDNFYKIMKRINKYIKQLL
uniref:LRRCT domain-containing protein n=1 Tax=Heterorhabditis bacteriophora TaxID=37862 RepID=A0A1I7XC94_HETBA